MDGLKIHRTSTRANEAIARKMQNLSMDQARQFYSESFGSSAGTASEKALMKLCDVGDDASTSTHTACSEEVEQMLKDQWVRALSHKADEIERKNVALKQQLEAMRRYSNSESDEENDESGLNATERRKRNNKNGKDNKKSKDSKNDSSLFSLFGLFSGEWGGITAVFFAVLAALGLVDRSRKAKAQSLTVLTALYAKGNNHNQNDDILFEYDDTERESKGYKSHKSGQVKGNTNTKTKANSKTKTKTKMKMKKDKDKDKDKKDKDKETVMSLTSVTTLSESESEAGVSVSEAGATSVNILSESEAGVSVSVGAGVSVGVGVCEKSGEEGSDTYTDLNFSSSCASVSIDSQGDFTVSSTVSTAEWTEYDSESIGTDKDTITKTNNDTVKETVKESLKTFKLKVKVDWAEMSDDSDDELSNDTDRQSTTPGIPTSTSTYISLVDGDFASDEALEGLLSELDVWVPARGGNGQGQGQERENRRNNNNNFNKTKVVDSYSNNSQSMDSSNSPNRRKMQNMQKTKNANNAKYTELAQAKANTSTGTVARKPCPPSPLLEQQRLECHKKHTHIPTPTPVITNTWSSVVSSASPPRPTTTTKVPNSNSFPSSPPVNVRSSLKIPLPMRDPSTPSSPPTSTTSLKDKNEDKDKTLVRLNSESKGKGTECKGTGTQCETKSTKSSESSESSIELPISVSVSVSGPESTPESVNGASGTTSTDGTTTGSTTTTTTTATATATTGVPLSATAGVFVKRERKSSWGGAQSKALLVQLVATSPSEKEKEKKKEKLVEWVTKDMAKEKEKKEKEKEIEKAKEEEMKKKEEEEKKEGEGKCVDSVNVESAAVSVGVKD